MYSSSWNDWFLPGLLLLLLNDLSSWPDIIHLWLMMEGLSHSLSFIHFKTNKTMAEWWWWGGGKGNTLHLKKIWQYNLYVPPQSGWAHEGKIPPIRIHEDFTPEDLWLEVKHLKEPPPERSCTCRFAAQGHPDYLTACAVSKAIQFLVIKPVSSCLLQFSGK